MAGGVGEPRADRNADALRNARRTASETAARALDITSSRARRHRAPLTGSAFTTRRRLRPDALRRAADRRGGELSWRRRLAALHPCPTAPNAVTTSYGIRHDDDPRTGSADGPNPRLIAPSCAAHFRDHGRGERRALPLAAVSMISPVASRHRDTVWSRATFWRVSRGSEGGAEQCSAAGTTETRVVRT